MAGIYTRNLSQNVARNLGDNLANRFQIIYKLGFGGMATVWLRWEINTEQWRAIKANAASQSSEDCSDLLAIQHMKELGVTPEQLETNYIGMPLETFWMDSPNGRHLCLVLPLLGPNLIDWRSDKLGFDMDRFDKLCYQTVKGLSFLHSKGHCHGDFRPQNILMKLKPGCIDHLSRDDVWDMRLQLLTLDKHKRMNRVRSLGYRQHTQVQKCSPIAANPAWGVIFSRLPTTLLEIKIDRRARGSADGCIRYMERFIGPVPPNYRQEAKRILEEHEWDDMEQDPKDFDSASRTGGAYKAGSTGKLLPLTGL
ncbi:hypothetical protein DL771_007619 [Monosporascus sp. 5C6A]|nr:hypothetical protein DL771_007619 [Monosporascus sp. 5C6A]